jgi:hypothetical protein
VQLSTTRREWFCAVLALIGGIVGGFASGRVNLTAATTLAQVSPHTINAQDIMLVDARGKVRAELNLNRDGDPGLSLFDHRGKLRTVLEISDVDGLGFKLFDTDGALRASLIINVDHIPALRLFDSRHHPRVLLGVDPEGEPALDFYAQDGKLLRELP